MVGKLTGKVYVGPLSTGRLIISLVDESFSRHESDGM
jgi:hypothetical protein